MGRVLLQMMMSLDGMLSGPQGELDWIAQDEPLNRVHQAILEHADVVVAGAGTATGLASYWTAAEHDDKAAPVLRDIARALNAIPKVVYSHHDMRIDWRNASVHRVKDDDALVEDVQRVKRDTKGTIVVYGGVRLARTFLQHDLFDAIHLDICPVILGAGQSLFTDLTHRTTLRLCQAVTYESGASEMDYDVVKAS